MGMVVLVCNPWILEVEILEMDQKFKVILKDYSDLKASPEPCLKI